MLELALSGMPMQGQPEGSWIGIRALDPVALMGRKRQMITRTEIHHPIGGLQRDAGAPPQDEHPFVVGLVHPVAAGGSVSIG